MDGNKITRIGPRMREALQYIDQHAGCSGVDVARAVGPNGSTRYGYRIVHRCIAAGLVSNLAPRGPWYRLHLTPLGASELDGGTR